MSHCRQAIHTFSVPPPSEWEWSILSSGWVGTKDKGFLKAVVLNTHPKRQWLLVHGTKVIRKGNASSTKEACAQASRALREETDARVAR